MFEPLAKKRGNSCAAAVLGAEEVLYAAVAPGNAEGNGVIPPHFAMWGLPILVLQYTGSGVAGPGCTKLPRRGAPTGVASETAIRYLTSRALEIQIPNTSSVSRSTEHMLGDDSGDITVQTKMPSPRRQRRVTQTCVSNTSRIGLRKGRFSGDPVFLN